MLDVLILTNISFALYYCNLNMTDNLSQRLRQSPWTCDFIFGYTFFQIYLVCHCVPQVQLRKYQHPLGFRHQWWPQRSSTFKNLTRLAGSIEKNLLISYVISFGLNALLNRKPKHAFMPCWTFAAMEPGLGGRERERAPRD